MVLTVRQVCRVHTHLEVKPTVGPLEIRFGLPSRDGFRRLNENGTQKHEITRRAHVRTRNTARTLAKDAHEFGR